MSQKTEFTAAPSDFSDVRPFDNSLRWHVKSRTSEAEYLVDVSAYNGNGMCSCKDFATRFGPFLSRGVTPDEAFRDAWVKPRDYQLGVDDIYRCWHIMRARSYVCTVFVDRARAVERKTG